MGIFLRVVCSCEKAELLREVKRPQTLPQFFQINAAGDWGGGWGTLPNAEGEASAAAVGGLSEGVSFRCPPWWVLPQVQELVWLHLAYR